MFGRTNNDGRSMNLAVQQTAVFNDAFVNNLRVDTITGPTGTCISGGKAYVGLSLYFNGPWPIIDPPSVTSGQPFFINSVGHYRMTYDGTATGPLIPETLVLQLWIDGDLQSVTLQCPTNQPNQLATLVTAYSIKVFSEGLHYLYYQSTGGTTSSANDYGSFSFIKVVDVFG